MRFLFACALSTLAAASFASYEFLAVTDSTNNLVDRFDPVTHASLGSFGAGLMSTPTGVALEASTGRAYVANNSSGLIQVWDYSIGYLISQFAVPGGYADSVSLQSNGRLLVSTTAGVFSMAKDGSNYTTVVSGAGYLDAIDIGGQIWSVNGKNLINLTSSQTFTNNVTGAGAYSWQIAHVDHYIVGGAAYNPGYGTYTAGMMTFDLNTNTFGVLAPPSSGTIHGVAAGHGPTVYSSNGNVIIVQTVNGGANNFTGPSGATFYGMDTVVAPEPSTLAAFGLGAVALIRKRRARA